MNTKTWQEEFDNKYLKSLKGNEELHTEDIIDLLLNIKQFITDLRKRDMEELIKMVESKGLIHIGATGYLKVSVEDIKQLIKNYYAK